MNNIRPGDKYKGGVDPTTLPYKKDDVVVFRKGARLHTMHPKKKGSYPAVRTQEITVNHVLSGSSITLYNVYEATETELRTLFKAQRHKDVMHIAKQWGFQDWQDEEATFEWLKQFCVQAGADLVLPRANPTVRWPGYGGYWVSCDINDIAGFRSAFPKGPKGLKAPKKRK